MPPDEGTPLDGSAFGLDIQIPPQEGPDPFADEPTQDIGASQEQPRDEQGRFASTDVAPAEETEPAAEEPEPALDTAETEAQPETQPSEPTGPEAPEGVVFAGRRFPSQSEAERAYREIQGEYTRSQQSLRQMEARQQQYEEALAEMIAIQQQQRAAIDPEYAQRVEAERAIQPLIEQRLAPLEQKLQQQLQSLEVQRLQMGVDSAIGQFRSRHPDVQDGTPEDMAVARTVKGLHDAWGRLGEELDLSDPNSLELAYEITQDPYLLAIHSANPSLSSSEEGMEYARWQAQQLASLSRQKKTAGTQAPAVKKVQPQSAFVETNAQRSPQQEGEGDEFDEVLRVDKADRTVNPFVGGKR